MASRSVYSFRHVDLYSLGSYKEAACNKQFGNLLATAAKYACEFYPRLCGCRSSVEHFSIQVRYASQYFVSSRREPVTRYGLTVAIRRSLITYMPVLYWSGQFQVQGSEVCRANAVLREESCYIER